MTAPCESCQVRDAVDTVRADGRTWALCGPCWMLYKMGYREGRDSLPSVEPFPEPERLTPGHIAVCARCGAQRIMSKLGDLPPNWTVTDEGAVCPRCTGAGQ